MENASKAILITGAILIVVVLIAIAVGVVLTANDQLETIGDTTIDVSKKTNQINKFIKYENQVTGAQVRECISAVLAHNSNLKREEGYLAVEVKVGKKTPSGGTADYFMIDRVDFFNNGGMKGNVNSPGIIINNAKYETQIQYLANVGTIEKIYFREQ